jgi:sulfate adenylyltransferase subunit 2
VSDRPSLSEASPYRQSHLALLEDEAIFVMREAAAQFERSVILFSGGKDSILLVHIARKAFWPGPIPFPLLHIDTGHNFPETLAFRDALKDEIGCDLRIAGVQRSIDSGRASEELGPNPSRNAIQSITLLDSLHEIRADAALGGARRDEEKSRAKERFFSFRDRFGQWDPKRQRPELWNLFNGRKRKGEHFRIFPLSNWTELDVWRYIARERIALPSLYFAHHREVVQRDGVLLAVGEHNRAVDGESTTFMQVRCRTIGDITCTGLTLSGASSIEEIIAELATTRVAERGGRSDDRRSEAAMEDRKREGYF